MKKRIEWNKYNYFIIGVGNRLKEVIDNLKKDKYEKCEFIWIEDMMDIQIPSFKFIFILIDFVDNEIIDKIERFYEKSNITILCSPLRINQLIEKYDSIFLIKRMFCPYFLEMRILLQILFTHGYMSINDIDFLHFFCDGKILKVSQYILQNESEESIKEFEIFLQQQLSYIIKGNNKILITEISSKNGIKVDGLINNNYRKYENQLEEIGMKIVRQYKRDQNLEEGKIRISMLLIGEKD